MTSPLVTPTGFGSQSPASPYASDPQKDAQYQLDQLTQQLTEQVNQAKAAAERQVADAQMEANARKATMDQDIERRKQQLANYQGEQGLAMTSLSQQNEQAQRQLQMPNVASAVPNPAAYPVPQPLGFTPTMARGGMMPRAPHYAGGGPAPGTMRAAGRHYEVWDGFRWVGGFETPDDANTYATRIQQQYARAFQARGLDQNGNSVGPPDQPPINVTLPPAAPAASPAPLAPGTTPTDPNGHPMLPARTVTAGTPPTTGQAVSLPGYGSSTSGSPPLAPGLVGQKQLADGSWVAVAPEGGSMPAGEYTWNGHAWAPSTNANTAPRTSAAAPTGLMPSAPPSAAPASTPAPGTSGAVQNQGPVQYSDDYLAAVAARKKQQDDQDKQQQEQERLGDINRAPQPFGFRMARGGGMPPAPGNVPPDNPAAPANAVVGEGHQPDGSGGYKPELVIEPAGTDDQGQPVYHVNVTDHPQAPNLDGGSFVYPLPPHLQGQAESAFPDLSAPAANKVGADTYQTDDGQMLARGGTMKGKHPALMIAIGMPSAPAHLKPSKPAKGKRSM